MTLLAQDTFIRSDNTSSWGTASDSNTWYHLSGASILKILSNKGTVTGSTANNAMALGTGTHTDQQVMVNTTLSDIADTGGTALRINSTGDTYYLSRIGTYGGYLEVGKMVSGSFTNLDLQSFSYSTGVSYAIKQQIIGSTLNTRIWAVGGIEPTSWTSSVTDTSISGAARYGIYANPFSTNGVLFDTFIADDTALGGTSTLSIYQRLRVSALAQPLVQIRTRLLAIQYSSLVTRLRVLATNVLSVPVRMQLLSTHLQSVPTRFLVSGLLSSPLFSRMKLLSVQVGVLAARLRLWSTIGQSLFLRIRVASVASLSLSQQLKLLATGFLSLPFRIKLLAQISLSLVARLPLRGFTASSLPVRLPLIGLVQQGAILRIRILAFTSQSVTGRLRVWSSITNDVGSRLPLLAQTTHFLSSRLNLWSLVTRSLAIRFTLSAQRVQSIMGRLRVWSTVIGDQRIRFPLLAQQNLALVHRLRLYSSALSLATTTRLFLQGLVTRSLSVRVRLFSLVSNSLSLRSMFSALTMGNVGSRVKTRAVSLLFFGARVRASAQSLSTLTARLILTPQFQVTLSYSVRALVRAVTSQQVGVRLRANSQSSVSLVLRFLVSSLRQGSLFTRVILHAQGIRIVGIRLALWGILQKNLSARLFLVGFTSLSLVSRLRVLAIHTISFPTRLSLSDQQSLILLMRLVLRQVFFAQGLIVSRFRLLAVFSPSLRIRARLAAGMQSVLLHRVHISAQHTITLPARLVMQGIHQPGLLLRFIYVTGYHRQDCLTRVVIALLGTPPTGFKMHPPIRTKVLNPLHTSGMTTAGPVYETGIYLVNGVMLETQPLIRTAPRVQGRMVPKDSQFTLIFADPTSSTQSLLQDGASIDMTILLQQGEPLTVPVQITTTSTTSSLLIVLCTLQQMVALPF